MIPIALTIAGSDSSGGAGIQADLKTFSALGVYGASAITAVTAQNTLGVQGVHPIPAEMIRAQIASVLSDLDVRAVKIGMVGNAAAIAAVVGELAGRPELPVVLDPVMVATSGDPLLEPEARQALVETLFPLADIVTPNLHEAAALLGGDPASGEAEMRDQARRLLEFGSSTVLLKGGHATGPEAVDLLWDGAEYGRFAAPRVPTRNTHGTGCTLAAAIAASLAAGLSLGEAVEKAKTYLTEALRQADRLAVGAGAGPVHHFHRLWERRD